MPQPINLNRLVPALGPGLAALVVWVGSCPPVQAEEPPAALEERLKRLEDVNTRLLEQLNRDRQESNRRYRDLEDRYKELQRQVSEPHAEPGSESRDSAGTESPRGTWGEREVPREVEETTGETAHLGRPGEVGRSPVVRELPLKARLAEGFQLTSEDDEFILRFHVLDQSDFKVFAPNNRTFGKSGLYVPRARVYLEGRFTKLWEYEVSLQRSVEGAWDLLDGNLNFRPSNAFQIKFGRCLVPYSYAWFDHLEQYFIAPERALFPLNFGLSRQAGLMGWGLGGDGRIDWALGGFNGHLTGLADNNPNQEAVGYLNLRPFLLSDRFPALRHLNFGASGALGQVARAEDPLPLRTSLQAAENDEAARDASAVFLDFNPNSIYLGDRRFGAIHLAYYYRGLSFESEWNNGRFQMTRPGLTDRVGIPVQGGHATVSYFLTGEQIERRTTVVPVRPFDPLHGRWGPGAVEPFVRYSTLRLGNSVFTSGLANAEDWTNNVGMVDLGWNWYPNRWVKFYFTWQHASYGSPVLVNEEQGTYSRSSDLLWFRCQVYF